MKILKHTGALQQADKGEWIQTDLGNVSTVNAIQINYADQDAEFLGKQTNIYHQYKIYYSVDGKKWTTLLIKAIIKLMCHMIILNCQNLFRQDLSSSRIFICQPENLPLADLRIFGNGNGSKTRFSKRIYCSSHGKR